MATPAWDLVLQDLLQSRIYGFSSAKVGEALDWIAQWDAAMTDAVVSETAASEEVPQLFGTSGIRGKATQVDVKTAAPIDAFIAENVLSPELAYWCGRSLGAVMAERLPDKNAYLGMDVRESNLRIGLAVMKGLWDEGYHISFLGVTPTPGFTLYPDALTLMITASHNPPEYNGIKVFYQQGPLDDALEHEVESEMSRWAEAAQSSTIPRANVDGGKVIDHRLEHLRLYYYRLMGQVYAEGLLESNRSMLSEKILPIDLAAGSAATQPFGEESRLLLAPPVVLLLVMGVVLVGYGAEQDAEACNNKLGAAYPYGETPHKPTQDEMRAFASGKFGYGAPANRSIYFPANHTFKNPELQEISQCIRMTTYMPDTPGDQPLCYAFPNIDALEGTAIYTMVMRELEDLPLLPGLMVDGDADRLLVTTPGSAERAIPFVPGELLIRAIVTLCDRDEIVGAATTVELGLSMEAAIAGASRKRVAEGKDPFQFALTAVGDKSLMTFLRAKEEGGWVAGEPSGHVIFTELFDRFEVSDDPFVTYLKLIRCLLCAGKDVDEVINDLLEDYPEVLCVRKPEAFGDGGLQAKDKALLLLRDVNDSMSLSAYAKELIPAYVQWFSEMYLEVFYEKDVHFAHVCELAAKALMGNEGEVPEEVGRVHIATNLVKNDDAEESLRWYLEWSSDPWVDPNTIALSLWTTTPDGAEVKAGEGIFRNSGTSPKNAGYHKLWPVHFPTGKEISEGVLQEALEKLAKKRVDFTDNWLRTHSNS